MLFRLSELAPTKFLPRGRPRASQRPFWGVLGHPKRLKPINFSAPSDSGSRQVYFCSAPRASKPSCHALLLPTSSPRPLRDAFRSQNEVSERVLWSKKGIILAVSGLRLVSLFRMRSALQLLVFFPSLRLPSRVSVAQPTMLQVL